MFKHQSFLHPQRKKRGQTLEPRMLCLPRDDTRCSKQPSPRNKAKGAVMKGSRGETGATPLVLVPLHTWPWLPRHSMQVEPVPWPWSCPQFLRLCREQRLCSLPPPAVCRGDVTSSAIPPCCPSETAFLQEDTSLPGSSDLACESFWFRACPMPPFLPCSPEIPR